MKIKNKKSQSIKKLVILVVALLVLAGGAYAYALSNNFFQEPVEEKSQTSDYESPNDPIPTDPVPTDGTDKENLGEEDEPTTGGPGVTITAASIVDETLQVRALIQGVVATGTCTLTVIQNSSTVITETADVQAGPSSSTCKGFNVNINNIENGVLNVSVSYTNDAVSNTSQARTVELKR